MYVRVSCAVPLRTAPDRLREKLIALGARPIITSVVIRTFYEGKDIALANKILNLYKDEPTADIYYDDGKEVIRHEAPL